MTINENIGKPSCCCSKPKDKELLSYNLAFKEKFVYKPAEALANYLGMSDDNTKTLWWYSNYAMNSLPVVTIKHSNILGFFKSQIFPINQVSHIVGGIAHALIGANPRCKNDQELYTEKTTYYHGLNFAVGYVSCVVAGLAYNYLRPSIAYYMNNNPFMYHTNDDPASITSCANIVPSLVNLAALTFLEGKIMCSIEKTVLNGYRQTGNLIGTVGHVGHSAIEFCKTKITEFPQAAANMWSNAHNILSKKACSWVDYLANGNKELEGRSR